jgi:hypothetical protein
LRQGWRTNLGSAEVEAGRNPLSERQNPPNLGTWPIYSHLFEPHGGVARHIQAQRLRLAHAMLGDPDCRLSVAAIAERVEHFDASAFSRAFRQEFGHTPSEARAAFGTGLPQAPPPPGIPCAADFAGILRRPGSAAETMRAQP